MAASPYLLIDTFNPMLFVNRIHRSGDHSKDIVAKSQVLAESMTVPFFARVKKPVLGKRALQ